MFNKLLKPNLNSEAGITFIKHNELKSIGIKLLFIDVDGTLLPRSETMVHLNVKKWINEAQKTCKVHLVSNNPSRSRIKSIAEQLNVSYTYRAGKPRRKYLANYLSQTKLNKDEVAIIGDRIFTDILAGNRLGIFTIFVKALDSNGATKSNREYYN